MTDTSNTVLPDAKLQKLCRNLFLSFPLVTVLMYAFSIRQTESSDCPVVIDMNRNGVIDITGHVPSQEKLYTLFSIQNFVEFDFFANGEPISIDWVKPNTDGFLIDTRGWSPDQPITGLQLFSTVGRNQDGEIDTALFGNGFEKLYTLDANQDNQLTQAELNGLAIWVDDGDAAYDDGEVTSLADAGVVEINLFATERRGPYGNLTLTSSVSTEAGESLLSQDVWFMTPDDIQPFDRYISRLFGAGV